MKRRGVSTTTLLMQVLTFLFFIGFPTALYFDRKHKQEEYQRWLQQTPPEVVKIIHLFKVCPLPLNEDGEPVPMSFACNDPLLGKLDFVVTLTPNFVVYGDERLRIAEIQLANADSLSDSEREMVCRAFKEINKKLRRLGRFSLVRCGINPVLRVGIPEDKINRSGGGGGAVLFSLFSLFSIF